MKNLFIIFYTFLFLCSSQWSFGLEPQGSFGTDQEHSSNICYFQMTTKGDITKDEATGLSKKIEEIGATNVNVIDYYTNIKEDPEIRFEKMIQDNRKCTCLAISGHHTGDFASATKGGILNLEWIEKLSCEHADWFKNVKCLYLDGPNTVMDSYLTSVRSNGDIKFTGDKFSTGKGPSLKLEEGAAGTIKSLNHSYANTLDEHTPLSSRYLRAFPNTNIYGFTEGNVPWSGGDENIMKHIALITKALEEEDKELEEAKKKMKGLDDKGKFIKSLETLTADACDPEYVKQWEKVSESAEAVVNKKDQLSKDARRLGCELINNKQILDGSKEGKKNDAKKAILDALKETVANADLSHLLINNILETLTLADNMKAGKYGKKDKDFIKQVEKVLGTSEGFVFKATLGEKLNSPTLSSLKRADYIKIHQRLWGNSEIVTDAVQDLMNKATELSKGSSNERILGILISDQLSQYDLLSREQIDALTNNPRLFPTGNSTDWQKSMKRRLEYRSYTATETDKKARHPFITNLEDKAGSPADVKILTEEILEASDTDTLLKLAGTITTGDYSIDQKNYQFIEQLRNHMERAPKGESRLDMANKYLEESKSRRPNPGKDNFQVNLLVALYNLPDEEFQNNPEAYGGARSKKEFFDKLQLNGKINRHAKPILDSIQRRWANPS